MRATAYLHSTKEQMHDIGVRIGLRDDALHHFIYALSEVEFELEVDEATGLAEIVRVDGRFLEK